jgi:adenylate kinase family enzyme
VKHVAILGPAGAGKSRLARELAAMLGIEVIHLDRLYWKPGWVASPEAEWEAVQRRELARASWIADGLQEGRETSQLWLDAADTIVFIDARPLTCIWRVARRRLDGKEGPEVPADSKPAPVYRAFPKLLRFLWLYRRTIRPELLEDLARREKRQNVAVLRTDEDVDRFLAGVKAHQAPLGESLLR